MRDGTTLESLIAQAREAVALAQAAGARDVWASTWRSRSVEMHRRDGALEKVSDATGRGLEIEIWVDGRFTSASTTDLAPERVAAFVADVVDVARALQPDPDRRITDAALFAGRSEADLDLVDPAVVALTREDRLALLAAAAVEVEGKEGVISATTSITDGHDLSAGVSSNGFEGARASTSLWLSAEVTLRDQGDKRPEGGMAAGARYRADVPGADWVGREALGWAQRNLGIHKGPTTRTTMILHPRAAGRMIGSLLSPANGGSVHQGRSFWAGKLGQRLISDKLTVSDDPLLPRGLGSRLWDGEGIAAQRLPLIDGGALRNLYLDTTYARKLGMPPTTGGASNRIVTPGARDLDALVASAGDAVLVTSWLGGNMDGTTGDFSYGLRGHLVSGGRISEPVGEMNVTGNLLDLFARLEEVGSDPWKWSGTLCPTLVFGDVQFSGA